MSTERISSEKFVPDARRVIKSMANHFAVKEATLLGEIQAYDKLLDDLSLKEEWVEEYITNWRNGTL
jgi:hypothetical protein